MMLFPLSPEEKSKHSKTTAVSEIANQFLFNVSIVEFFIYSQIYMVSTKNKSTKGRKNGTESSELTIETKKPQRLTE